MSELGKRRFFWIITLSVSVLFLAGLESALRLFDYGGDLALVRKRVIGGVEYYTLNRDVGRRYFTRSQIAVPEAHDEPFALRKPPGTVRIFMLGESTMAGFPYDYNATPPDLLRDRLSAMYPQARFEIINAALSAVNSYTVSQFAEELAGYEPDLFVVYVGHNEFYGALGVGSSEFLSHSSTLVRAYLRLLDLRTFRLLRDAAIGVRRWFHPDPAPGDVTLIAAMAREKAIPFASADYFRARDVYQENLRRIIAAARADSIPVILSTVACNLRDQKPMTAAFSRDLPEERRAAWSTLEARGRAAYAAGAFTTALACFDSCVAIDNYQAQGQFERARTLDTLGLWDEAARAYARARDYDVLRFRASTDFNDVVRQTCLAEHVACADIEQAFSRASEHGLTGRNLILEHVHPNFDGYFLIAKVYAETIADSVRPRRLPGERKAVDDAGLRRLAGITPFDAEVARYRVSRILDSWPFHDVPLPAPSYEPRDTVGELAVQYAKKRVAWSQAHYAIAGWYARRGDYMAARDEYYAVSKVAAYSYYPLMQMGDMERLMEKPASAESLYRLALAKEESPYVHVRLGMLLSDLGKEAEALQEFERTFAADERSPEKMDTKARSMARFLLGAAYGRAGDIARAKANLRLAVDIDPQNVQAKNMLARIP